VTAVDFSVIEGVRSRTRQQELVKAGASKTLNSRHITGHAVDLAAYVGGQIRWDWPLYYRIALAVRKGSEATGVAVEWGGVWDRRLSDLPDTLVGMQTAVSEYVARCKKTGKVAFIDGPHFQVPREFYK
jgi:peptidoglycan L-alanyl-D-glutamate endopeptidase CwlK